MKPTLQKDLENLQKDLVDSLKGIADEVALAKLKAQYLGKKGKLTDILKGLGRLSPEERPKLGAKANEVKSFIEEKIAEALQDLKRNVIEEALAQDQFDMTLPGRPEPWGHIHPVHQVLTEVREIFEALGFITHLGPEIEDDYHNFEALNIPANHPARDLQDTFYLKENHKLLRTHTSTVQIHVMEKQKPPVRIIAPGAVYRCDSDVTHTPMFHQVEGLWIDEATTFSDLKGVLTLFIQKMFGEEIRVRFRPSYFPFTEPSAELDMSCVFCRGEDPKCPVCKGTGWIEVLGCGMVDPAVFEKVHYDPEKFTGFAFGIGMERLAMLKFGINDLRLFFENDNRFFFFF